MNMHAIRGFFVTTLALSIVLVSLMLLDYFYAASRFFSAVLVSYGALVIITAAVMIIVLWDDQRRGLPVAYAAAPTVAPTPAPGPPAPTQEAVLIVRPEVVTGLSPHDRDGDSGPFVYGGYTLHTRTVDLKSGGERRIYFFSKRKPKSGTPVSKPPGYHVGVNEKTGLPFLKKGFEADGEDLTPEAEPTLRPQCAALTDEGSQCRNSARESSRYCASHFGYQPPVMAKAEAVRRDTVARVSDAPDTLPAVRRRAR